jgi:ribosomal protein L7Ae-like RNA K-turn-binding protein
MSSSKRHFTVVIRKKEQGSYVSSSPSSAARKAVSKLCADNKNKKVKFSIRETTQNSKKKTYGPYIGYMQKLDKPVELKGLVIKYKPIAKLDKKGSKRNEGFILKTNLNSKLKQKGGMNCVNDRVFKNLLKTCWMIAIQMIMCFGDATKDQIERELTQPNTTIESISNLDKKLKKILPSKYSCLETTKRIDYLNILLDAFIKRYIAKIERHFPISVNPKENPKRCELVIQNIFFLLFQNLRTIDSDGGSIMDYYYFGNLLGTFFLKQEIYFSMHTRKMFNQISFDEQNIGIIIEIKEHVCCFFVCGGVPKFYNDHDKKIYDFDFMNLLSNLKDDEDLFVVPNKVVALNRTEYFENIEKYTEYKRIILLTVVSKNNLGNNFNQEIKLFFDEEYDEINNFYLLLKIGINFLREDNEEKYLYFLKKGLKDEYYLTMFLLGEYFENLYKLYPPENPYNGNYLDNAIEYYQKALDNGYNKAAERLVELYKSKGDIANASKYLKYDIYTKDYKKL